MAEDNRKLTPEQVIFELKRAGVIHDHGYMFLRISSNVRENAVRIIRELSEKAGKGK